MNLDNEKYLEQLKVPDLEVSERAIDYLSKVMNRNLWRTPSDEELQKSRDWIHSPIKREFEKISALIIAKAGGEYFVEWAKRKIEQIDGEDGFYRWEVGFFSLPDDLTTSSFKLRTMRVGAENELETPFHHKSFGNLSNDSRILKSDFVHFLRRSGLDGLTEIVYGVTSGDWSLVAPRPYNSHELQGTRILYNLSLESNLDLSTASKDLLDLYPKKANFFRPKCGIFGPLAAFDEEVSHMTRMMGDVAYWDNASLPVDFRILFNGIYQRIIRGVNSR